MTDYRRRRSKSADWADLSQRDKGRAKKTLFGIYGRSESEGREGYAVDYDTHEALHPFLGNGDMCQGCGEHWNWHADERRRRCPECFHKPGEGHADGCKVGAMAEMGHGKR